MWRNYCFVVKVWSLISNINLKIFIWKYKVIIIIPGTIFNPHTAVISDVKRYPMGFYWDAIVSMEVYFISEYWVCYFCFGLAASKKQIWGRVAAISNNQLLTIVPRHDNWGINIFRSSNNFSWNNCYIFLQYYNRVSSHHNALWRIHPILMMANVVKFNDKFAWKTQFPRTHVIFFRIWPVTYLIKFMEKHKVSPR